MRRRESRAYALVRGVARALLWSQYRRIEVEGADRVPAEGPVLLVANHFSAIADSMALLHACGRPVSFLAKAPLFRSALLRPFLEATGPVPVFRPQDAGENEGRGARANLETFAACQAMFSIIVIMVILTTLVTPPVLTFLLKQQAK